MLTADQFAEALTTARGQPTSWQLTLYPTRLIGYKWASLEFPGANELRAYLEDDAVNGPVTNKGDLPVLVHMRHVGSGRRRVSAAAAVTTGVLVDLDTPGTSPEGISALLAAYDISHVAVRKASGWHVLIQLAPIVVPPYDGPPLTGSERKQDYRYHQWAWYQMHRARVMHLLTCVDLLLEGPKVDKSCASGLAHCDYVYRRRSTTPDVVAQFWHHAGAPLDLAAFCAASGFVEPEIRTAGVYLDEPPPPDSRENTEILDRLRTSLTALVRTGARGYQP